MFTALKIWEWIKSKWQWFLGGLVGLVTFLAFLTRGKQQKKVLDIANKSHEKENSINEKAKEDLVEGLAKISEEKDKKVKEIRISIETDKINSIGLQISDKQEGNFTLEIKYIKASF